MSAGSLRELGAGLFAAHRAITDREVDRGFNRHSAYWVKITPQEPPTAANCGGIRNRCWPDTGSAGENGRGFPGSVSRAALEVPW
jgi:hypothetical protein